MKHVTHPAFILIDSFCTHYNNRDMKALMALFSKKASFKLWNSDEPESGLEHLKKLIQQSWTTSTNSELFISSAPIVSTNPSCWAISLFTLTTEYPEELYTYTHLKGNVYGVKERNTWKINMIRFNP